MKPEFRGLATEKKVGWVFGLPVMKPWGLCIQHEDDPGRFTTIDPATLSQFIGLLDGENKKIFVGDICKRWDGVSRIVCFGRYLDHVAHAHQGFYFDREGVAVGIDGPFVVIGNIYENPKLLERKLHEKENSTDAT